MWSRIVIAAAASLVAALPAAARPDGRDAAHGSPGTWTRITEANGRNTDQVGVARGGDGRLHVFWQRRAGAREAIAHASLSPAGAAGPAEVVLEGFRAVDNPDAVVMPDGRLRVFFMGLGDTVDAGGVVSASAPAGGGGWAREGVRISNTRNAVGPVGATVSAAGEPVSTWSMSFVLAAHVGLNAADADLRLEPDARCCDYLPDAATGSAGETVVAWYANADGRRGIWARQLLPSVGPPLLAPGSVAGGNALGLDGRTPVTGRLGAPGVVVGYCGGYPVCTRVLLWRVGAKGALRAGSGRDVEDVGVAAAPEGRVWVFWHDGRSRRVFAVRTNRAGTRVGPVTSLAPPPRAAQLWKTAGDGALGRLDLLVSASTPGSLATWHTQVLPRLSVAAAARNRVVSIRVSDAGDPVAGARVVVGGRRLTTNAAGRATVRLRPGTFALTASSRGYARATGRVRVR